jgi:hypothetical protein
MNDEFTPNSMKIGKEIIIFMRAPRFRPPKGHGGKFRCFSEISLLIRRGGAPSGVAATIIIGAWGSLHYSV